MCKIHAVKRRLHLLREFICKSYWGWLEVSLYLFPLFFSPFGRDAGRATSSGDICTGIVWLPALPKLPPLQKCLQWVGAVGARGAPLCLHAVSRRQCNTAATTSIISPLICGSGTHTGTGCSRMRVHVSETSCKQLHKNVVIRNVPVDLNMGHFYRASGGAGFWSQGQRARKCVLPFWTWDCKPSR